MWNGDMQPSATVVLRSGVTCSAEAQQRRQQDRRQQRPNRAAVRGKNLGKRVSESISLGAITSSHPHGQIRPKEQPVPQGPDGLQTGRLPGAAVGQMTWWPGFGTGTR
jgi:hypothetical protein